MKQHFFVSFVQLHITQLGLQNTMILCTQAEVELVIHLISLLHCKFGATGETNAELFR